MKKFILPNTRLTMIVLMIVFSVTFPSSVYGEEKQDSEKTDSVITFLIGDIREEISSKEILTWFSYTVILTRENTQAEIENIHYCEKQKFICDRLISEREKTKITKKQIPTLDEEKIDIYLEDISRRITRKPVDARFIVEDDRVTTFTPSTPGVMLNVKESKEIIKDALLKKTKKIRETKELSLAYTTIEPDVHESNLNNYGIKQLIGEGRSNFKGSTLSRIHNIKVAASRYNGLLIKPEEEFSFTNILGPVDADHGYKEELVIRHNKTELEYGGGICQVSTTLFRAAILSGMKITARKNHSYPVKYYSPIGFDATIYVPRPDLRFINNTPNYILMQTELIGTELIFRFYGTLDDRTVEMDGPHITERTSTGGLKTLFTQTVKNKDGSLRFTDVFKSNYDNPDNYPKAGDIQKLTSKPHDWSQKEWTLYKNQNGL